MPHCTSPGCNKAWEPATESSMERIPLCTEAVCPLRALQRQEAVRVSGQPLFQTRQNAYTNQGTARVGTSVAQSLNFLRDDSDAAFHAYNMDGAQSACTTVKKRNGQVKEFKTQNQMHSEMRAIDWMLEQGEWTLYLGLVLWKDDLSPIATTHFHTTEPHCGFCTIFLLAAGLPVGKPTCGNHKLASRLNYQLPVSMEISPHYIARVLDKGCYCGFPALKRVLNAFIGTPASKWVLSIDGLAYVDDHTYIPPDSGLLVIDWFELVKQHNREVIYLAWKVIYEQIQATNKQRQ